MFIYSIFKYSSFNLLSLNGFGTSSVVIASIVSLGFYSILGPIFVLRGLDRALKMQN